MQPATVCTNCRAERPCTEWVLLLCFARHYVTVYRLLAGHSQIPCRWTTSRELVFHSLARPPTAAIRPKKVFETFQLQPRQTRRPIIRRQTRTPCCSEKKDPSSTPRRNIPCFDGPMDRRSPELQIGAICYCYYWIHLDFLVERRSSAQSKTGKAHHLPVIWWVELQGFLVYPVLDKYLASSP